MLYPTELQAHADLRYTSRRRLLDFPAIFRLGGRNEPLDRCMKVLRREVSVSLNLAQGSPATKLLDRPNVYSGHSEPGPERVEVAVPGVALEPAGASFPASPSASWARSTALGKNPSACLSRQSRKPAPPAHRESSGDWRDPRGLI